MERKPFTSASEFYRGLYTLRREKAVEALLADGWKWDGLQWTRPATAPAPVAGDAVAKVVADMRERADDMEDCGGCEAAWSHSNRIFADRLAAALAQDRASQSAAPAPVAGDAVPSLRWLQDNHAAWVKDSSDTPYLVWLHNAMTAALSSTAAPALSRVDPAVSAQLSEDVARQQATAAEIDALCATAPVAGDAVCEVIEAARDFLASNDQWNDDEEPETTRASKSRNKEVRRWKRLDAAITALAQDRASQSLPSPVPGDQVGDIVARWMEKKLTAEQAMLVIKRHLDHCYMQPANDYNRGWVAGANSVTERAAGVVYDLPTE